MALSPQTYDLCIAADVAADLGVTSDDRVQRAVTTASRLVADYCSRTFEKNTAIVEYPSSNGRSVLSLKRPPIASITSITEQGTLLTATDYECVGDNVEAGLVVRKYATWMNTRRGDRSSISDVTATLLGQSDYIVATYAGGYVTPGQNALDAITYPTVTLPAAVQEAAIFTACSLFRSKGADPNIKSEAIGDWSIGYFDSRTNPENVVPSSARGLLAPYKIGWGV